MPFRCAARMLARHDDQYRDADILDRRLHRAGHHVDAYGAPFVAVVALKQIAGELGSARSVPALAYSLAWLGSAFGGIAMGRIADRIGVKWTVAFGGLMIAVGLAVSTGDSTWRLWIGHGIFIGLLGNGGINAPCYVYVAAGSIAVAARRHWR